ncbi:MAG: DUF5132 domain-containing protein [Alphaproteobacteria bacterium]|uniref:DUF5132 domain-containing protein n=1 Tax=Candidatus Nitrobium versatile TaxID=2884831 RepID=A0A953M3T6_9BACT|nr:DUF5132 domain-containing protein [Candidatus Nitrobium versatile]
MALFDNGLKGNIFTGLAIGLGAAVFAPAVLPVIAGIAKPVAKAAIKGGLLLFEKGKETLAEAGEVFEDLVAEVKAELSEEHEQTTEASPEDEASV